MTEKVGQNFLSTLDFCFEVSEGKIAGDGEDSFFYSVKNEKSVFGVFDGCGGSGARRYEKLQGKTGAYIASRAISTATKDWFESPSSVNNGAVDAETLKEKMQEYLSICKREGESKSLIKGSMSKAFPTTAAIAVCIPTNTGVQATCIWAGDSRCYLLDESGIKQLTDDDIGGFDAMENLVIDDGLTNVISASSDIRLHTKTIDLPIPCLLFSATDGCFDRLTTPMEFEFLLVDSLLRSNCVNDFELNLTTHLKRIARDDFTLCGCSMGFGSMKNLQSKLKHRHSFLWSEYIEGIESKTLEEKTNLWHLYSGEYSKYLVPSPQTASNRTPRIDTPSPIESSTHVPSQSEHTSEGLLNSTVNFVESSARLDSCDSTPAEADALSQKNTVIQKDFRRPTSLG